jgi:hypothetical protein
MITQATDLRHDEQAKFSASGKASCASSAFHQLVLLLPPDHTTPDHAFPVDLRLRVPNLPSRSTKITNILLPLLFLFFFPDPVAPAKLDGGWGASTEEIVFTWTLTSRTTQPGPAPHA